MTRPGYQDSSLFHTPWPANMIARYLTVGGATVDITHETDDPERTVARCTGCNEADSFEWNPEQWDPEARLYRRRVASPDRADEQARSWAQRHAEKCRALPRPAN